MEVCYGVGVITKWIVMAHRTAGSVLGAADAPCKQDGKILKFDTKGAAEAYRTSLTEGCKSANVFYTVEPYDDETQSD